MKRVVIIIASFFVLLLLAFLLYPKKVFVAGNQKNDIENITLPSKIKLSYGDKLFEFIPLNFEASYNFEKTNKRIQNLPKKFYAQNIGLYVDLNKNLFDEFVSIIDSQISVAPIYPSAMLENGVILINKGKKGTILNTKLLKAKIEEALSLNNSSEIIMPVTEIDPSITDDEVLTFRKKSQKFIGKKIVARVKDKMIIYEGEAIISMINKNGDFDKVKLTDKLNTLASEVNHPPQEPKLTIENGKVSEFLPSKNGVEIDFDETKNLFNETLKQLSDTDAKEVSFEIPVKITAPKVTTEEINNLGINELIGRGESTYFHSIPGRVHNVALAASRVNGTLIAPGEEFSFNKTVGDISSLTGYKTAYVIKDGRTVLGDGGGVCQVSTTLFRAVLNAGLPIDERRSHAYRVSYYEQGSPPGLDATVYSPTTDFKFTNDTPGYILIQAVSDPKNYSLAFEFYGTSDGRVATTTKPVVTGVSAPPPDLYQDDPTLPAGTVKQVDFPAWGAKVTFNYSVKRNNEEIYKKTFVSNYRPWQAVYLKGVGISN